VIRNAKTQVTDPTGSDLYGKLQEVAGAFAQRGNSISPEAIGYNVRLVNSIESVISRKGCFAAKGTLGKSGAFVM
jgi:hypothetical protein